jgi:hypothetical protein
MVRQLIEKEVAAVKDVLNTLSEWVHPTKVMKGRAFDRPLDDLGQTIDDLERKVQAAPEGPPATKVAP